jgi:phosphonate degradation associated HDIG domain protein
VKSSDKVALVFDLLKTAEHFVYIGEPVSQLEHALQAAYFAQRSGATDEETLAALLHDVGHFCGWGNTSEMGGYGVRFHEKVGATYLMELGFSSEVADLIEGHVQAKRYLVAKRAAYSEKLSEASAKTLEFQGGPMNESEVAAFEQDPRFKAKLRLRQWDEMAKETELKVPRLDDYRAMIEKHLTR